jgi:hypothetical protein
MTGKFSVLLSRRWAVASVRFGSTCSHSKSKRLSLRIRRGEKDISDRWLYLDSINMVLIIEI